MEGKPSPEKPPLTTPKSRGPGVAHPSPTSHGSFPGASAVSSASSCPCYSPEFYLWHLLPAPLSLPTLLPSASSCASTPSSGVTSGFQNCLSNTRLRLPTAGRPSPECQHLTLGPPTFPPLSLYPASSFPMRLGHPNSRPHGSPPCR